MHWRLRGGGVRAAITCLRSLGMTSTLTSRAVSGFVERTTAGPVAAAMPAPPPAPRPPSISRSGLAMAGPPLVVRSVAALKCSVVSPEAVTPTAAALARALAGAPHFPVALTRMPVRRPRSCLGLLTCTRTGTPPGVFRASILQAGHGGVHEAARGSERRRESGGQGSNPRRPSA